jgi:hypothetical protein
VIAPFGHTFIGIEDSVFSTYCYMTGQHLKPFRRILGSADVKKKIKSQMNVTRKSADLQSG